MIGRNVVVAGKAGLHARPASEFTKAAARFRADVFIEFKGKKINGKSILNVLGAGIGCGSAIRIVAEGEDEAEAADALARLLSMGGGE